MIVDLVICRREFNFWKIRSWLSWLIRKKYGSWSNHAAFIVRSEFGIFVVDSDFKGLKIVPFENWAHKKTKMKFKKVEVDQLRLFSKVGKSKYDYRSFFLHLRNDWKNWRKNLRKDSKRFTCYEFIGWVLGQENWHKFRPVDVEGIFRSNF